MTQARKKEIDSIAVAVLAKYGITSSPCDNLRKITDGEGITLLDYADWDDETCGRILQIDGETVIFYNANHRRRVQNFTIAHELGHHFLGHVINGEKEIICLERDLNRMEYSDEVKANNEAEANHFAVCLLLPIHLLIPAFHEFMISNGRNPRDKLYVDNQQSNYIDYKKCIKCMQTRFTVSETALRFRLVNLGLMQFNIQEAQKKDRGIYIAEFLEECFTHQSDAE